MGKRTTYTQITPLPPNVPRQLALDMLHAHGEVIELNPLVTGHKPISPPRDASSDEYFAQWYEISEIITWGFGMKKKISFKGVFHDMPWGLQTHIYAPMGVDMRNKYQIRGNQPGEPREVRELGVDAPSDGLYIREDVEIVCNIALAGYVKKEAKQTIGTMIERMSRKAELLDDGVLHAMFENGKLKTMNPTMLKSKDTNTMSPAAAPPPPPPTTTASPPISASSSSPPPSHQDFSPEKTFTKYHDLPGRINPQRVSMLTPHEIYTRPESEYSTSPKPFHNAIEMEGSTHYIPTAQQNMSFRSELADTSVPYDQKHASYNSSINSQMQGYTQQQQQQQTPPPSHATPYPPPSGSSGQRLSVASSNAYTANGSPMPSPLLPRRSSGNVQGSGNQYTIANPDQTSPRQSVASSSDPSQQSYPSYSSAHTNTTQSSVDQGLANRVSGLGLSDAGPGTRPPLVSINSENSKCPICGVFEGDPAAVSHHVNRSHFG